MTVLSEIADELYALPLADFTAGRDARAKQLKGSGVAGEAELSSQVKALKKPSLAAWVLNLFVRREAEQVEQVLTMGAALREAQRGMSADELRALTKQRRQLTAAITQRARGLASSEGVKVTQAVADQVEATLSAAMVDEACGQALRTGLLVTTLATTGVDDVDASAALAVPGALGHSASPTEAAAPARPDLRVVPDPDAGEKARAAAEDALVEAQDAVTEAQAAYDDAVVAVEEHEAHQLQLEAEIDELKRKIAELEERYDEVDDDLGEAEDARNEAFEMLREATVVRDAAATQLDTLR